MSAELTDAQRVGREKDIFYLIDAIKYPANASSCHKSVREEEKLKRYIKSKGGSHKKAILFFCARPPPGYRLCTKCNRNNSHSNYEGWL